MSEKTNEDILRELTQMSRNLGKSERNLVIIGEGNTSALLPDGSYYLKASGFEMSSINEDGFVRLKKQTVLDLLEKQNICEDELKKLFNAAKVNPEETKRPSVEALMHALCLSYEDVRFIAHTHPCNINRLTCSKTFPENLRGRMYPDEIVLLGEDSVFIPYTDPGIPLACEIKKQIDTYISEYGSVPKCIYMQNHGFVALGASAREAENITLTAEKAAFIRLGAIAAGGINLLDVQTVRHIMNRPDEKYRKALFASKGEN